MSIDGKIATRTGDSKLSSTRDLVRLHKLRSSVDGIIVGKNTVIKDDPMLNVRYGTGKNPVRIILDSKGEIPSGSKILQTSKKIPTIIAVSSSITKTNLQRLDKFPVEIITTGKNTVNLKSLLNRLAAKNLKTILVEGGGTVNWEFVKRDLFDELIVTLSPYLIGGSDAVSLVEGAGFDRISKSPNLRLESVKNLKNHLVLNYHKV